MFFSYCGRPTGDSWAAGPSCSDWRSILVRFEVVVGGLLDRLQEFVTFRTCVSALLRLSAPMFLASLRDTMISFVRSGVTSPCISFVRPLYVKSASTIPQTFNSWSPAANRRLFLRFGLNLKLFISSSFLANTDFVHPESDSLGRFGILALWSSDLKL